MSISPASRSIAILTQSHLCRNPRVVKEALALSKAGYDVSVNTVWSSSDLLQEDKKLIAGSSVRYQAFVNIAAGMVSPLQRHYFRVIRKLGLEAMKRTGRENRHALGYGTASFLRQSRGIRADLIIGHLEMGIFAGSELAVQGRNVGFDMEDWYSEDLLPDARRTRPVQLLRQAEANAFKYGCYTTTTSEILASELQKVFGGKRSGVIYNVFPANEIASMDGKRLDRTDDTRPSLYWFSQVTGPGRGIEFLIDAIALVEQPIQLHLRGMIAQDYKQMLISKFPSAKGHLLFFHDLVPPAQLLSRMAEHDIGLALEERAPLSRDLTITNKILHYLLGGLATIGTPTLGQLEAQRKVPSAIRLLPENATREDLAGVIRSLVSNRAALAEARKKARESALETFCWEKQEPVFLEIVRKQWSQP
jgi:hypothetical protein